VNLPVIPSAFSGWKYSLAVAVFCFGALLPAPRAFAQVHVVDATQLGAPRLDLGAGWLVHAGDNPAYARPDFDDSHWAPFNAATGSLHNLFPHSRPSVVWYRLHVKVRPGQAGLALRERQISSAFVVYTNGIPLIRAGSVAPFVPYNDYGFLMADIPAGQLAAGSIVIAVRARLTRTDWSSGQPGLMDWKLSLGEDWGLRENSWLQVIGNEAVRWLNSCILLCLVLGALLLYFAQRKQVEYLWLALFGLAMLLHAPIVLYGQLHTFPAAWDIVYVLAELLGPYLMARMYLAFARWPLGWRLHAYIVISAVLLAAAIAMGSTVEGLMGWLSAGEYSLLGAPALVLSSVILPVIMIVELRRGNREAGILLLPLLLGGIYDYVYFGSLLLQQIPSLRSSAWAVYRALFYMPIGPLTPHTSEIVNLLSLISLALIILLRTSRTSRREALLESEMANARAVQQVILPDHAEAVPGYEVESVYEPAQQVGGDFFQVLPDGAGGLLVVIGDVAGKGLPAAMLVSVLVGAIRTAAAYSQVTTEILAQLNERLIGRVHGGFSTALAARIAADGAVTIANAGHLPPYLDGREIALPGALPLGVVSGARYETMQLQLAPGSQLTFYSDGVVEAQNERGELFGFDRGKAISSRPAAEIAATAKQFGQLDDITVVAIRRAAAIATAA